MDEAQAGGVAPLVGAWRLRSFQVQQEGGGVLLPFGERASGSLIYTDSGQFAAQVAAENRFRFVADDPMEGTPAEMQAAFRGFISYFGHFECHWQGGFVVHHVERSLFPNWEGQQLKRFMALAGDRLTLTTTPISWGGGGQIVAALEWQRVG